MDLSQCVSTQQGGSTFSDAEGTAGTESVGVGTAEPAYLLDVR